MSEQNSKPAEKSDLEKRLDAIGWGLFLIMIGGLWLAPEDTIPEGMWLIGTGIIILGISFLRYYNNIRVNGFMVFLGIIALGAGISDVFAVDLPVFPILLIILGASMILKPYFEKK
jgi:hypothetical protein